MIGPRPLIVLTADDYALTEGVSRGIEELATAGRLSATGAMVTFRHWRGHSSRIAKLRARIAVGLHVNLTLGAPLGPLPRLAPSGALPAIGVLTRLAFATRLDTAEIAAEVTRQLDTFDQHLGFPPDYLDGHQHAHALPQVREAVLEALARRTWKKPLLIRDPAAGWSKAHRRGHATKAWLLAGLTARFAARARDAGFIVNDTFGGVTDFRADAAAIEMKAAMSEPGRLHIAMCHPGYVDAELAGIDPVTDRREAEMRALMGTDGLGERIWHPRRVANGPPVDWQAELACA